MNIRAANVSDLPAVLRLERACPAAAHWTESHYRDALVAAGGGPERLFLVASPAPDPSTATPEEPALSGFLVARYLAPEWELENIVVAEDARRRGIGRQLLSALMARAREANSQFVFLEVRESNLPARALYEKAGFREAGRRKGYYTNPPENAILYRSSLL